MKSWRLKQFCSQGFPFSHRPAMGIDLGSLEILFITLSCVCTYNCSFTATQPHSVTHTAASPSKPTALMLMSKDWGWCQSQTRGWPTLPSLSRDLNSLALLLIPDRANQAEAVGHSHSHSDCHSHSHSHSHSDTLDRNIFSSDFEL